MRPFRMNSAARLPLRITLLLWLVLIITAWNVVRTVTGIAWRDTLELYASYPGPFYIATTGAIWSAVGLFVLWSSLRRASWTRMVLLSTAGLYAAWTWIDRLFLQRQLRANWPFSLAETLLFLGYVAFVVLDPRHKIYFVKRGL